MSKKKIIKAKKQNSKTKNKKIKSLSKVKVYIPQNNNEHYPKLIFKSDSLWHKIQRLFGYRP